MIIKGIVFRDLFKAVYKDDRTGLAEWFLRAMVASNWTKFEMESLLGSLKSIGFREIDPFDQKFDYRTQIYSAIKTKNASALASMISRFLATSREAYCDAKFSFLLTLDELIRTTIDGVAHGSDEGRRATRATPLKRGSLQVHFQVAKSTSKLGGLTRSTEDHSQLPVPAT